MTRKQFVALFCISAAIAATLSVTGCGRQAPQKISSPWPVAERERTVPRPAEPPRWPYTGKSAKDEKSIHKRPLSVKIENSRAARPQTGPGIADVVYESIAEGGITRFNCIFHSKVPAVVGPVRSARLSDLWIVPQYDGLFFFSGASSSVENAVNRAKLPNMSQDAGVYKPYFRSSARSAPHNLYLDTKKAYAAAKEEGYRVTANLEPLRFDRRAKEETVTVTEITVPFSAYNTVRWEYRDGMYARYNDGKVHMDQKLGKQITAKNVVVMWAKYEKANRDKVGSNTFRVKLGGTGRVTVFRNGTKFDGEWVANRTSPPRFRDKDGRPIKLAVGRTWFQVIPLDGTITMK